LIPLLVVAIAGLSALQVVVGAAAVVAMFLLLVVPHEGGHFGLAKLFGIRVDEFSVGMGPRLWSATRSGTLYAVRAIPLGGYVRLRGMEPDHFDDPNGFHVKPAYQRLLVLLGGPAANFIMASLILFTAVMLNLNDQAGKIASVNPGSPAAAAGLRSGDVIVAVDGKQIRRPEDIRGAENAKAGQPVSFTVRHTDGRVATITIQPFYDASPNSAGYKIGIATLPMHTPAEAVDSLRYPFLMAKALVVGLYDLATGQIPGGFFGPQGATGVIGISKVTYEAAEQGPLQYWELVAAISVALGLANLLPLPALDGGRILVVIAETLRRAPFNREKELAVQRAGLVAMIALILVIAYFDVQRIATGQFPGH